MIKLVIDYHHSKKTSCSGLIGFGISGLSGYSL